MTEPTPRPGPRAGTRAGTRVGRATASWVAALDGALDGVVLAFVLWTLWYELALVTQWSLWWPARVWILLALVVVAWSAVRAQRAVPPHLLGVAVEKSEAARSSTRAVGGRSPGLAALVLVVVLLVALRDRLGVTPLAIAATLLLLARELPRLRGLRRKTAQRGARTMPAAPTAEPGPWSHGLAALSCVALAVLASLLVKFDADDAYYVNRATWVAQHGTATLKDTMFSPGALPSAYIGGPPLPSIEALQGGVAHALGLSAPSVTYLLTVPLVAALAGWALWRLVRDWAPEHHLLVHVVALLFLVLSAGSIWGNYYVGRAWQGKVIAVVVVLPLVWLHLGRLARGRQPHSVRLLGVCGIAFVGLTSTAALLAPVIFAAALLTAVLLRARHLAVGASLFLLAPLLAGLVAVLSPSGVGGDRPQPMSAANAVTVVFGSSVVMVSLAVLALALAPGLVRGPAGILAACGSLASFVAALPGMFGLVNVVTGAGPVIWRLLIGTPTAVLVGLLVTWGASGARHRSVRGRLPVRYVAPATAGLLAVLMVVAGLPLWSSSVGSQLSSTPRWKLPPEALADVRALTRLESAAPRSGRWLLPETQSNVLSATTTTRTAVVPRRYYVNDLPVDAESVADRSRLAGFVAGTPLPVPKVRRALRHLDVSVACVPGDAAPQIRRTMARAAGGELRPVGSMLCHLLGSSAGGGAGA